MGVCSSCLGGRRRESVAEDDESRLLFDDPSSMQYGSFGEQQMTGHDDPLEAQREIEALQRVVARTSDNMVDIFEIAPNHLQQDAVQRSNAAAGGPTPYALAGQEARLMRYHHLLSKLNNSTEGDYEDSDPPTGAAGGAGSRVDWHPVYDEDDTIEMQQSSSGPLSVKTESRDALLVGTFREAAQAMA